MILGQQTMPSVQDLQDKITIFNDLAVWAFVLGIGLFIGLYGWYLVQTYFFSGDGQQNRIMSFIHNRVLNQESDYEPVDDDDESWNEYLEYVDRKNSRNY